MTGNLRLLDDVPTDREERPAAKRDGLSEQRRFAEREHEKTERIRELRGLPPLCTDMPAEGAACPWRPDEDDTIQTTAW